MTRAINNTLSGNVLIDSMLKARRWDLATAAGGSITYNFPTAVTYYSNYANYLYLLAMPLDVPTGSTQEAILTGTFTAASTALQSTVTSVLSSQFANTTGLVFAPVGSGAPPNYFDAITGSAQQGGADMSIGMANLTTGGFGVQPGDGRRGGDVWFDTAADRFGNAADTNGITKGENDYRVVLHEIGHSLGLRHPHAGEADSASPTSALPAAWDSMEFTVMTYRMYVGGPAVLSSPNDVEAHSFAQSLMMLDIQALQYMYGADFTTNADGTNYTFDPNTGEMFINGIGQGRPGGAGAPAEANRIFLTIWDGGGDDTYEFLNYTTNLKINLAPGGYTNLGTQRAQLSVANNIYARGNIFNALMYQGDTRSLIENAIGGSGNDTILGNQVANVLQGYLGNDLLSGLAGDDRLYGDAGRDTLSGGTGNDSLYGGTEADSLVGGADNDQLFGEAGNDTLDGGTGDDILYGGTEADSLVGGTGNDYLQGDAGKDTLVGGDGDDRLYGGTEADLLVGSAGNDQLQGEAGNDTLSGGDGSDGLAGGSEADVLSGGAGADQLTGNDGNDTLYGGIGNDGLFGGTGADSMAGGAGDDSYQVDDAGDKVVELLAEGTDSVVVLGALASYTLAANVENLSFLGYDENNNRTAANRTGTGNALNNQLWSFYDAATLSGGLGNDTLQGSSQADSLVGGDGNDRLVSGGGKDTMVGGAGNDTIVFTGIDHGGDVSGGDGNDTLDLSGLTDTTWRAYVDLQLTEWSPFVFQTGYGGALSGIENVNGGAGQDLLYGTAGANVLNGGSNGDRMEGRGGNDTYYVDSLGDTVIEAAGTAGGVDTVILTTQLNYTLADNVETLIYQVPGFTFGTSLTGNGLSNTIIGSTGREWLDGGIDASSTAIDILRGGDEGDFYTVRDVNDRIVELAGGGYDSVYTELTSYTLPVNVEVLYLRNSAGQIGIGNASDNQFYGASGADSLVGLGGNDYLDGGADTVADTLVGGAGNDVYNIRQNGGDDKVVELAGEGIDRIWTADATSIDLNSYANVENIELFGTVSSFTGIGNALANQITSFASNCNDSLVGGAGNDTLTAGVGGVDVLKGGTGNDTYDVSTSTFTIDEINGNGIDTVNVHNASASLTDLMFIGAIENLNFGGTVGSTFFGTGNALANIIGGAASNDYLDGGATDIAADTLIGSTGDDTYYIHDARDVLVEYASEGYDTVVLDSATTMTYTLGANFEALQFVNVGNHTGIGNALGNRLAGNAGNNVLKGLVGNDYLLGGDGADTLYGGAGLDTLYGEGGANVFVFDGALAGSADTIGDFVTGTDKLWLDDAVMVGIRNVAGALDATQFVNLRNAGASLTAATRIYEDGAGALFYDRDGSGAAAAVKIADLGAASLFNGDIKVI